MSRNPKAYLDSIADPAGLHEEGSLELPLAKESLNGKIKNTNHQPPVTNTGNHMLPALNSLTNGVLIT